MEWARTACKSGRITAKLDEFLESPDAAHRQWAIQIGLGYGEGLPGKRPEHSDGNLKIGDIIAEAGKRAMENRARHEQQARKMMDLPLEEVEKLLAAEDERDEEALRIRLRGMMREERQELDKLRAGNGAEPARLSESYERESNRGSGGRPALPPAPEILTPEIVAPEAAELGAWPKAEELGRVIRFEGERK